MDGRATGRRDECDSRHGQHFLMGLLQGIHPLLEVDVVRRQLGLCRQKLSAHCACDTAGSHGIAHLVIGLAKRLLGVLKGARRKGRDLRAEVTGASAEGLAIYRRPATATRPDLREVLAEVLEVHGDGLLICCWLR